MSTHADIWVVDDDEAIRFVLQRALSRRGYEVECFERVQAVEEALANGHPQAIITDIRLPDADGLSVVDLLARRSIAIPVIAMTAYSDLDQAVTAFQKGVFEYLPKPFDLDQVISVVERAVARKEAVPQPPPSDSGSRLLGESPAMQEVFRTIGRLSRSDISVLITGETGSGKEVVAQVLHQHSPRANGPFIAINTAAIPAELLESELFGHEKGSFTAPIQRVGRFEEAAGAPCSSTKSATCRCRCRRGCCACWRRASSTAWAGRRPSTWTCASSRRPTRTSRSAWRAGSSVRTCSIGST
jgi:two-component system nitrogen regulation response regulator GlnG